MNGMRISGLLGKITVFVAICCCCLPAQAKYGGGSGTSDYPYLIYDANQMNAIGADSNDWDKHFILMADINLSGFTGTEFNIVGRWIGFSHPDNRPFSGVFDGNDHTISNFTYTSTDINGIGLFGYIRGLIRDLGLIDPNVDAGTGRYVGSLGGCLSNGTISNCYVQGASVKGDSSVGGLVGLNYYGTISNCYSESDVSGMTYHIGGLVGWNIGTISNCYSTGDVSGDVYAGGLVGYNSGTITNCYAMGSVSGTYTYVGGLVGFNVSRSTIINSYSTASVTGYRVVGGLVGENWYGTITNCYSTGSVSGDRWVGGLVGYNNVTVLASFWDIETSGPDNGVGTPLPTEQMQMMSTFTDAGWDFESVWWILEGAGYPRLCWEEKYGGGTGHPNDPYLIYTAEQMNTIGACQCDWDKCFLLCADINLSAFTGTGFNIIGERYYDSGWVENPFTGVFDGNGHTISNFTYTSTGKSYIGLFGYIDDHNAQIKNLGLIEPNVDTGTGSRVGSLVGYLRNGTINNCYAEGGSTSGSAFIGGLVGSNSGTISNCYSTGSVLGELYVGGLAGYNYRGTISNCYSSNIISGDHHIGGLVGSNGGTITNCYSTASVTGNTYYIGGLVGENHEGTITNCYSSAEVSGYMHVGGLVGYNGEGTISNCCATGTVSGNYHVGGLVGYNSGTITNCYSTAFVSGDDYVGGLVGYNNRTITNCYSTGSASGDDNVGGLVGYNSRTISNCYSTASATGTIDVGGLAGESWGAITNCYSTGSVAGDEDVGGFAGSNSGTITNCYSTGGVSGHYDVGGFVGDNYYGIVSASFWDIQTSGQTSSDGGTGKTTSEMQMASTFIDAGWDFLGETFNGIEDIWFIPQQDYPHLWWEGMQVPMKLTPRTLNCRSYGNWVKAHLTLPQGFTVADVDSNRPAVLHSFGFESAPLYVFVNKNERVQIDVAFEREAVCSLTGDWPQALTVAGFLADGNIFLGTSTVRIIHPGLKVIEELALYWLNADCVHPDFCDRIDMNRDSLVNLLDYALLLNSQVEFVSE